MEKIINPLKKYENLNEACQDIGFDITYPGKSVIKEIYTIEARGILEIRFSSFIVRKAKCDVENLDISGVYSGAYPGDCYKEEFDQQGNKGFEYWNGSAKSPKAYLSVWHDKNYQFSYSVYAPKGMDLKAMTNWQKNLK